MSQPKQKKYTAKSGKEYTFQHPGVLNWVRKRIELTDYKTKRFDEEKLYYYLHEHIIVEPKVDFDYWDENIQDFEEVTKEAQNFLRGRDSEGE